MLRSEFEQAIGRAIADSRFCARLLSDPVDALMDYGLEAQEARSLKGLHGVSLEDLVLQIARVGAEIWGPEFRSLLRNLRYRLPAKRLVDVAGFLPISGADPSGQALEALWSEGIRSLN